MRAMWVDGALNGIPCEQPCVVQKGIYNNLYGRYCCCKVRLALVLASLNSELGVSSYQERSALTFQILLAHVCLMAVYGFLVQPISFHHNLKLN